MTWQNWARSESITPQRVAHVTDQAEIAAAIAYASQNNMKVKAVGAGHSFTGIAAAPGIQLNLSGLSGLLAVDAAQQTVTLAAGTHLHQVPKLLASHGLAMINLGDIDAQTISGATSTGTHGTGASFGGLATQITGLSMITADLSVLDISAHQHAELFHAARLGLGALGIITSVTVQCVSAFQLHAVERPEPLQDVLDNWEARATGPDHFEFYWFPHTPTALTKTNTRLPLTAPSQPLGGFKRWIDDDLMANKVFGLVCSLGKAFPSVIPPVNRLAQKLTGDREFTDVSTSVFTTMRKVRFREMEYALPRSVIPAVLRDIDSLIKARGWRISFPLEVRAAAPDDLWLSTAYGRETGYIAVHRYFKEDHYEYFQAVEQIFRAYEGRPHWGKIHYQDAASLSKLYPRFGDFVAVRDKLDPNRLFSNDYLNRVLG
ncbi:D-arabinono-1,4-lactone oxidase [Catelliglobosispora koreensis]|uniref:D-arabinono-1,4-lactone oxidase n=1 Tax=Catelliglobosispora koreensis TaxID=129052 RepID=UPI000378856D|nr:D-arabinono-1,4-lactone oxidase [Catelliglobosispora koreensis]